MKRTLLLFDHNHGKLEGLARACGGKIVSSEDDSQAAVDILASDGLKLVFGHLDKDAWAVLKKRCNRNDVLVRFTTSLSDEPSPMTADEAPLFLQCRKPIAELGEEDLKILSKQLASDEMIARLRSGETPFELRPYFNFQQPNYTMAIAILATGALYAPVGKRETTLRRAWWEAVFGNNITDLKEQLRKEHGFADERSLAKALPATARLLNTGFKLPSDEKDRIPLLERIISECSMFS